MILVTFISIHFVIICDGLLWRTYETHPTFSLKSGCDKPPVSDGRVRALTSSLPPAAQWGRPVGAGFLRARTLLSLCPVGPVHQRWLPFPLSLISGTHLSDPPLPNCLRTNHRGLHAHDAHQGRICPHPGLF
jgi:hypothetical protein